MTRLTSNEIEYSSRFIERNFGVRISSMDHDNDLHKSVYAELSRREELDTSLRDTWGNWDWQYAERQREGNLYVPSLDKEIIRRLSRDSCELIKPKWPNGKSFAIVLTHDVDLVSETILSTRGVLQRIKNYRTARQYWLAIRHGLVFTKRIATQMICGATKDPLWHYEDWMKIEDQYGFKSTFYFFPSILIKPHLWDCTYKFSDRIVFDSRPMHVSDMIREMYAAGWDIGLHGSYHSATNEDILRAEKQQLEDVLGSAVTSTRQHYLHYDIQLTPGIQHRCGITNDSTHGFNRAIGFRSGTTFPYYCWDHQTGSSTNVLEIPMHVMDVSLFSPSGLEYNQALAVRHALQLMDQVESIGGCLCINWHPNYINVQKYWNAYSAILSEAAIRNAWGCSAKELENWWRLSDMQ
jgi:hypothetical protein